MANRNITNKNVSEYHESIFRYLCPSFLSFDDILQELQIRCFKIKGLEKKSKDELTQIFIKHLMPLPQRLFPNNYQGNLINKMIRKENASSQRHQKQEENESRLQYGFISANNSTLTSLSPDNGKSHRLKPPIDSSNVQNKRISISKTLSSSSSSSSKSSIDKIVINSRVEKCQSTGESLESTKIELKRAHSETEDDVSPSKKSRQRIAWP